jgi:DNA-binding response OmpR family regulator
MSPMSHPARILVVEDDEYVRRVLTLQLTKIGFEVVTAATGDQGFEMAKSVEPDLILLDLMMPGMDGFQVLKRVKSIDSLAAIPVIILTASHDDRHRRKGMSHLAARYLTKPYTLDELQRALENALSEAGTPATVPGATGDGDRELA